MLQSARASVAIDNVESYDGFKTVLQTICGRVSTAVDRATPRCSKLGPNVNAQSGVARATGQQASGVARPWGQAS